MDTPHALAHPSQVAQFSAAGYVVLRRFVEGPLETGAALESSVRKALEPCLAALDPGGTVLGAYLALDACSPASGRWFGWSGSHKLAGKPRPADYVRQGDYARDLAIALLNAGLKPRFIELQAGDLVVWARGFEHGEAPASPPGAPRRALVLHFGARVEA